MDKLLDWVKAHALKVLGVPIALSSVEFIVSLLNAVKDGVVTDAEFHNLISYGNPVQLIVTCVVFLALKKRND